MLELHDLLAIGTLILLEGLLSADNALILAVLVKHLPGRQRQRALLYGIVGAFILRFLALGLAKWFLKLWYMNALGGAYLAYLALAHFLRRDKTGLRRPSERAAGPGFWRTVGLVELTDFAFAMDSILVAVGVSDKLWVVYTGGVLGIIAMRIAAGFFVKLLERFPSLEDMAYVLVAWVSVKMLLGAYARFSDTVLHHELLEPLLPKWLFWSVMGLIVVVGVVYSTRRKGVSEPAAPVEPLRPEGRPGPDGSSIPDGPQLKSPPASPVDREGKCV